ncbi:hypothetical protein [Orientia tsutsugamushi]|nr:hypothetical protein [Orientia tsutsugamushi]
MRVVMMLKSDCKNIVEDVGHRAFKAIEHGWRYRASKEAYP